MRKNKIIGFLLVSPSAFLIISLLIFPIIYTFFTSLHRFDNLALGKFIGLKNYAALFNNKVVVDSLLRGFLVVGLSLFLTMVFGILASLWIYSKSGSYGYFLQLLCLIPWFTSLIVAALTWRWLINTDYGPVNSILRSNNLPTLKIMETPFQSFMALVFIMAWRTTGYVMILVLSGLKALPNEMLEAARVDGAKYFQTLFYIIFPNIKSQIILSFIMITLSNINNSTIPLAFNAGGPANATNTVALEIYQLGFLNYSFDQAASLSVILLLINIIIIFFYMRIMKYE
jgi:ABC-type sugar transport system permease subunit